MKLRFRASVRSKIWSLWSCGFVELPWNPLNQSSPSRFQWVPPAGTYAPNGWPIATWNPRICSSPPKDVWSSLTSMQPCMCPRPEPSNAKQMSHDVSNRDASSCHPLALLHLTGGSWCCCWPAWKCRQGDAVILWFQLFRSATRQRDKVGGVGTFIVWVWAKIFMFFFQIGEMNVV